MPRGFRWAVYVDDTEVAWAVRVDSDAYEEPGRGWTSEGVEGLAPLPRLWQPRKVTGIDESGRTQSAVVSDVSAGLWTGLTTTFTVEANDNVTVAATVISRTQEVRRLPFI